MNEAAGSVTEMVSGRILTAGSAPVKGKSVYGRHAVFNGSINSTYTNASVVPYYTPTGTKTGDATMMMLASLHPDGTQISVPLGVENSADTLGFSFIANAGASFVLQSGALMFDISNSGDDVATAPNMIDDTFHVYFARRSKGVATLFRDGISAATVASTRDIYAGGVEQLRIGGNPTDGTVTGSIAFAMGWNRGLSDQEVVQFSSLLWDAFVIDDLDGLSAAVVGGASPSMYVTEFGLS